MASGYVLDLIRRDGERSDTTAAMQRLINEARAGGVCDEAMADIATPQGRDVAIDPDRVRLSALPGRGVTGTGGRMG